MCTQTRNDTSLSVVVVTIAQQLTIRMSVQQSYKIDSVKYTKAHVVKKTIFIQIFPQSRIECNREIMQMKMGKKPVLNFDNKKIRQILETEDEFISNLLGCFEVPTSVEGKLVHENRFHTHKN